MRYDIVFNFELGAWEAVRTTQVITAQEERVLLRARTYLEAEDEAIDLLMVDRWESDHADIGSEFDPS